MISIVFPVYNVEKFVEKSINSILNQTYKEFELIIINDGSTDASLKICEKFLGDKRIKICSQKNGGLSNARNEGLKLAAYDYVTFIDSDDWIEPNYLEVLYNCAQKHNADIVIGDFSYVYTNKPNKTFTNKPLVEKVYTKNQAISLLFIDEEINNYSWGKLFDKKVIKEISFPEGKYYEDIYTTYTFFAQASSIVTTNGAVYNYLQHDNSITSRRNNSIKKDIDVFDAFYNQFIYFKENEANIIYKNKVIKKFIKRFYSVKKNFVLYKEKQTDKNILAKTILLNDTLTFLLKKTSMFKIGILLYVKSYIAVYSEKALEKYLLFTRKNR